MRAFLSLSSSILSSCFALKVFIELSSSSCFSSVAVTRPSSLLISSWTVGTTVAVVVVVAIGCEVKVIVSGDEAPATVVAWSTAAVEAAAPFPPATMSASCCVRASIAAAPDHPAYPICWSSSTEDPSSGNCDQTPRERERRGQREIRPYPSSDPTSQALSYTSIAAPLKELIA